MRKLLPILVALFGLGSGIGAGMALRPDPQQLALEDPCGDVLTAQAENDSSDPGDEVPVTDQPDYVKLNNQFVVPVVSHGRVASLVVMSLSLELSSGGPELVYQREPKLRDAFLQVMFDHANTGGFDGNFTSGRNMDLLRTALREAARKTLGSAVMDVLIIDVVRQET